jgi:exopolysaccharide biosynthesis protein
MSMARFVTVIIFFIVLVSASIAISSQPATKLKTSPALAVTDPGGWKTLQRGVEFRKIALERSEPSHSVEVKLLRFDTQWIVPRVLRSAQFQLKGATAKTFAEKSGALAAINANYFDTDGKPLAFLKVANQMINSRVAKTPLYTGVFGIKDQKPFITQRDEFVPDQCEEGLQSGPLLLFHGIAQDITTMASRPHRRALIAMDQEQRLLVAVADSILGGLHLPELQELFSDAAWQIRAMDLLNLDGGGSAQIYIKTDKFMDMVAGTSEVPVAIGFFRRSN